MNEIEFMDLWHQAMLVGLIVFVALAVVVFLVYSIRVASISDYKIKHDFINASEVAWLKRVALIFGIGIACLINLYGSSKFNQLGVWFGVRVFMSIAGATVVYYTSSLILDYYYPTRLSRKLRKWRYMPRLNPKTGSKLRLLTEAEEDVHLDEGMKAEENIFSIDYDVWIDDQTKEVKIEKYQGHLLALECHNCGFYTMRVKREEIMERNEAGEPTMLLKHYECSYCKNVRATQFPISSKQADDYREEKAPAKRVHKDIEGIKIEILNAITGRHSYEFQTLDQAQKFLEEYDIKN
ncbi:MAG: hypothetical protein ACK5V5_00715 [Cyclobacteriaceae bacterium]|jgi:hypothetical protein|nr:hypothetical protein [Flammeovirgaceae bacterium]